MKHASEKDLARISGLLKNLRTLPGLKEKKLGIFYRKARAFLHFHEDQGKLYVDIRLDGNEFTRLASTTKTDQDKVFSVVSGVLKK